MSMPAPHRHDTRIVASVSAAHFVSHYYILLLPPLFAFVRAEYQVSYTELGLAITAFNVVSAVLQTPAGFLVDRVGARIVLIAGLLFGAGAFAIVGLVHSYWLLVAMFGVAGIGNAVYHPADYAILSHQVSSKRIGQAFSVHTFAGLLGGAVAPGSLLLMQGLLGWRGAFLGAAVLGAIVAIPLVLQRDAETNLAAVKKSAATGGTPAQGWQLLLAPAILINLAFFILLSLANGGLNNFTVVALGAAYGTDAVTANAALSGLLFLSAIGVLAGGVVVGWTSRHSLVASIGLVMIALTAVVVASIPLVPALLIVVMSIGGFFFGLIMPSRDLLVRQVTPPGAFGRVFGFVTTGFNIGGMVAPVVFGLLMDAGHPRAIFFTVAACSLLAIATVTLCSTQRAPAAART
jgi:FSR family fosmidomycin resistance protein-like MFS transporter